MISCNIACTFSFSKIFRNDLHPCISIIPGWPNIFQRPDNRDAVKTDCFYATIERKAPFVAPHNVITEFFWIPLVIFICAWL